MLMCPLCESVGRSSADERWIATLTTSMVFLGENQRPRGWCVLVLKDHVEHVAELDELRSQGLWRDVCRVAAAIRFAFPRSGKGGGPPRINYECLGNLVPHVHWHIVPRHGDDPYPTKAVWVWPEEELKGAMSEGERVALIEKIRDALWDVNP